MSLSRAFTKRTKRPEVSAPMPYREGQIKFTSGTINRGKISAPVQLLSTTNMLAYNAPDLHSAGSSSSSSLQSPDDLLERSHSFGSAVTTPEDSPVEPNPLSPYFPKRSATVTSHPRSSTSTASSTDAPMVPKRALSHTKRSHQELARQRSVSRMSPPLNSMRSTPSIRTTQDFFKPEPHPFSKELAQVNEVAEEFGGGNRMLDEEEQYLYTRGLRKFTANDYLVEIEDLYGSIFDDHLGSIGSGSWL
ncbi:hypothetical protein FE257_011282 [Aspergillus nanangensis]|uniref:Uncharacterized protein n=1 Tax=Aspergillus nanangensis TaxID=2582783 RepID=A0AAD4CHX4_ASPNN|nr:hypothetical protein FE257_011282 [Aspergillus nanangensis]